MTEQKQKSWINRDGVWVFTTYFAEGFPYTIIRTVSAVFFREMKVSLEAIGLTSLFGLPWVLKFLWSPQVDAYSSKRRWLLSTELILVAMMALAAIFAPAAWGVMAIAGLFFIGSIVASTHDIAIDGYYLEALDRTGQARYVGLRVMAYRIAMMTGTGVIVTIGAMAGWWVAFAVAGIVFGGVFIYHATFLAEVQRQGMPIASLFKGMIKPRALTIMAFLFLAVASARWFFDSGYYGSLKAHYPIFQKVGLPHLIGFLMLLALIAAAALKNRFKSWLMKNPESYYSRTFISFADRDGFSVIIAFIILLRAGEFMLGSMISPFIVDLGMVAHYGWISSLVGLPASIMGSMLGGYYISKRGLGRVIWPFILAQNLTLLLYMALALHEAPLLALGASHAADAAATADIASVAVVHFFEQFAGGLGTSVLMTYLMRLCKPDFKAAHYAIGSGLMSLSGLYSGTLSGFLAGSMGYAWAFGLSFVVSIPAMILIPKLPALEKK